MTAPAETSEETSVETQDQTEATEETSLHYDTHEEADAAARRWQSQADQTQSELNALGPVRDIVNKLQANDPTLTPEAISDFVRDVVPLTTRPDFAEYVRGDLAKSAGEPEDDFRSDEEKRLDSLEAENRKLREDMGRDRASGQSEMVEARFERAESEMQGTWGDLWAQKRGAVLGQIQQMSRGGMINGAAAITPDLLNKAFLLTFKDANEMKAVLTKATSQWEDTRVGTETQLSTGGAMSAPASRTAAPPTNFKEAWEAGQRDSQRRGPGG